MSVNRSLYGDGILGPLGPADRGPLAERFLMPPFSVWNTREGFWQDRKRRWLSLGIESETGREDALTFNIPITLSDGRTGNKIRNQTSIFDPVVCEICYRWWCPPGGIIIDPFAGGSVRGIIASMMGMRYWGCELREEQVIANRNQLGPRTQGSYRPKWWHGDSRNAVRIHGPGRCQFIFSCPPYGNLEVYSDDPADLSNKPYEAFLNDYNLVISSCVDKLDDNCFAAWVVANYRDKKTGEMRDFVGATVAAFAACGMELYNDIILVNAVGSAAMRANTSFLRGARKVVKCHQNVLVFLKGNAKAAAAKLPLEGICDDGSTEDLE